MFDIRFVARLEIFIKVSILINFLKLNLKLGSKFTIFESKYLNLFLYQIKEYFEYLESTELVEFFFNLKKRLKLLTTPYLSQISPHQLMSLCFVIVAVLLPPFLEEVSIHSSLKFALQLH
jgi:hypothetical protein